MVDDFEFDEIELSEEAIVNAERYRRLDCEIFGEEYVTLPVEDTERIYLVEDFNEVNDLFLSGAKGDCKCPAPLLLLLWKERKYLKKRLRKEGLWENVNK